MTLRDLLLVLGAIPLLGVVALRLAAEMGYAAQAPPPEALRSALWLFGAVFVLYVALTLRAIASATRDILARDADPSRADVAAARKAAAVSDFAIHLDRSAEVDLRTAGASEPTAVPHAPMDLADEPPPDDEPRPAAPGGRTELFGEVNDLLTRIPSARSR